jgi:hypothetical protein
VGGSTSQQIKAFCLHDFPLKPRCINLTLSLLLTSVTDKGALDSFLFSLGVERTAESSSIVMRFP